MSRLRSALHGATGLSILGLVVVALALIAAIVYMLSSQSRTLADAFRPSVESTVILSGVINDLHAEGKLVVLTADVTAESQSSTAKRIFFDMIDAGTTTVRVRAPARVQYIVPLEDVTRDNFLYDAEARRVVLILPRPRLDTTIVEVSTDPAEIEVDRDVGWLRLELFSGRFNEERARRLLRDAAVEAGRSGQWLDEAQESARTSLRSLLEPLMNALQDDVQFDIVFHDGSLESVEDPGALPRPRTDGR